MELTTPRTTLAPPVETPSSGVGLGLRTPDLARLLPLWRHAVWALALFAVLAAAVAIRLDVQQMRKDLDRNARAQRESHILNDRLRLEVDARRRVVAVEAVAAQLSMTSDATIVRLPSQVQ